MSDAHLITVKSLKEQVYEYFRQQLSHGVIRPGDVVNLDATSRKLGISKTPLREALIMLEVEGFVKILPRKGVYVNELSLQDIHEFYQIIGALEATALVAGMASIGPEDLERMAELNAQMKAAIDRDDFGEYYSCNLEFHDIYINSADNQTLIKTVHTLKKRLYDFPRQRGYVREWEEASIGEHRRIHDLMAGGDAEAAAAYVRDVHWSFKVQQPFILQYYETRPDEDESGEATAE